MRKRKCNKQNYSTAFFPADNFTLSQVLKLSPGGILTSFKELSSASLYLK